MNTLYMNIWIYIVGSLFCANLVMAQEPGTNTETQFVDVDGYKYNVKIGGLEHLEDSIPVVVLELGAGSILESWKPIFGDLSKFAPVFAYERSGVGKSEWNGIEQTPLNATIQLRKLLNTVDLPPPYILAGHSWGGVIIRTYAGNYKNEVKALAYIDPMDYENTLDKERSIFSDIGVNPDKALKFIEDVTAFFTEGESVPPGIAAQYKAIDKFEKTDIDERRLGKEPNVPLAVFIGTKMLPPPPDVPGLEKPFDTIEWFDSAMKKRIESLSKWPFEYSSEGYLFISPKATHYFHIGEPDMVIEMIRRFVDSNN